jgi:hypothetical protein
VSLAAELLHTLRARGIVVEARGDRLRYRPRHGVTEDELAIMRQLKPDLLRLLTIEPCGQRGAAVSLPGSRRP